jgi:2',3'-cyclic-nucleotide 2'-phosphodiesterase (5'-nucleotidase family)
VHNEAEHILVVDAGDSLLSLYHLGDFEQGELLADAYNEMGYDAVALGGMDFRMGLDVLRAQIDVAAYPVLSANTLDPQTGEVFDKGYTIVTMGSHEIALIGLTDAQTVVEVTGRQVEVLEPVETLIRTVQEIGDQADLIIVLSHLGFMFDANLSQVVSGIDLIVSGRDMEVYDPPLTAAGPVIVSAGSRGEYVGRVDLKLDAAGNVVSLESEMQVLDDRVAEDPEMRRWMVQSGLTPASALKSGQPGEFTQ